jgi:hypothetical protein
MDPWMHQIIAVERREEWLRVADVARRAQRPCVDAERGLVVPRRRRVYGRRISWPLTVRSAR